MSFKKRLERNLRWLKTRNAPKEKSKNLCRFHQMSVFYEFATDINVHWSVILAIVTTKWFGWNSLNS